MRSCRSCRGTYQPVGADGVRYFHVCPPLAIHELQAARAARTLVLSRAQQRQLNAADAADRATPPAPGELARVDQVLGTFVIERVNHRDENVTWAAAPGEAAPIRRAGAGVDEIADD
jgi:hypothetical protein